MDMSKASGKDWLKAKKKAWKPAARKVNPKDPEK